MHNVIGALRYMAKFGGAWHYDNSHGTWTMANYNPRGMRDALLFSQAELRAFLQHYDELNTVELTIDEVLEVWE